MKQIRAAAVSSGKVELPDELRFLKSAPFLAAKYRETGGVTGWFVEIRASWVQGALAAKRSARKAKAVSAAKDQRIRELEDELSSLRSQNSQLDANNAQLLKNIEDGPRDRRFPRSPKNYFQAAEDHGFKTQSLPLQGGLPGLGKR